MISLFFSIRAFAQGNCSGDQSASAWHIDESVYGSKLLSECHTAANYNCHGFVMNYFENYNFDTLDCHTTPSWSSSLITAPYMCPTIQGPKDAHDYQSSGKYVRICTEPNANIAYYILKTPTDYHSAVKEVVGSSVIKYISKYGHDGPLVAHNLEQSHYHEVGRVDSTEFWAYIGGINGNQNIVGTDPVSFNVTNNPGVNYSWSIINGNSNVSISSANNLHTVSLTAMHNL